MQICECYGNAMGGNAHGECQEEEEEEAAEEGEEEAE